MSSGITGAESGAPARSCIQTSLCARRGIFLSSRPIAALLRRSRVTCLTKIARFGWALCVFSRAPDVDRIIKGSHVIKSIHILRAAALVVVILLNPTWAPRTMAAPITFDVAAAPFSSAKATLGSSVCIRCSINATLASGLHGTAFTLDAGESATFDFFRLSVNGIGAALAGVTATLGFDSPSGTSITADGDGMFVTFAGIVSAGVLVWNDLPTLVSMGDGSLFSVSFSDVAGFTLGNFADVTATVTVLRTAAPAAHVDEPGALQLALIALVLGSTLVKRKRSRRKGLPS